MTNTTNKITSDLDRIACNNCASSKNVEFMTAGAVSTDALEYYLHCKACGKQSDRSSSVKQAIENWFAANTKTTTTMAQKISALFNDDGQVWESADGLFLVDLCQDAGPLPDFRDDCGDVYKYDFDDGSTIIIAGNYWDIGFADCFCTQSAGHNDDCANR